MTIPWAFACVPLLVAAFTAIACERARAYGRPLGLAKASSPVTIAATLAACGWWCWHHDRTFPSLVMLACAGVCALSDIQTGYVFDRVLIAALALMIPASVVTGFAAQGAAGAALSGLLVMTPHVVSRGRAIGFGDVKLAATIGFALGPGGALRALWWACVSGGAFALALILARKARRDTRVSFAPFLALGASCITLVWH